MSKLKANDRVSKHTTLFEHDDCKTDWTRQSILQDVQAEQYQQAQKRLKRWYSHCFGIDEDDWQFVEAMASLRNQSSRITPITREVDGEYQNETGFLQTLMQGHGVIRDYFDADTDALFEADLIYYPSIDGQERQRLIYKPFYCLSSNALDCIDVRVQGPDIGDLGESVTHSLGCRLVSEYLKRSVEHHTGDRVTVEYYVEHLIEEHTIDVVVRKNNPETSQMEIFAVVEVETGLNRESEVLEDFTKLGHVDCSRKFWISPTRNIANRCLNVILARDWLDIDTVPEELPLLTGEGVLHNTNQRLKSATFEPENVKWSEVPHTPVTDVLSYQDMYDMLKTQYDPTLFDLPRT
ncbi:hypothetical protein [Halostagnicola sp. A-GB9-2]|uniref:hypothetical protein n=1 Tax=Halostagnicola sp. A-GB9-2 TaxID=3048066 RepID=UPI0024C026FB|nr:hypothetical protein [Halostagnicola sp. A-GB9-2]MDJ1431156.1 hypothetical protein [Halostagnicola sp. A-GB9-2]